MRSLRVNAEDRPTICAPAPQPRVRTRAVRARPPRRIGSPVLWRRLRARAAALAALAILGGGIWAWRSGFAAQALATATGTVATATTFAGLALQDVELVGREHVPAATVLAATGLHRGDPILFVDLDALRARVEAIGWIAGATIERRLPGTIRIEIVERRPFARWQVDGKTMLIDRSGAVLERDDPEQYRDLLRVVGPGAAKAAAALFSMLATEPALGARVVNAIRVRDRRWDLEFDNGVIARLPENNMQEAWKRLAAMDREQKVLARDVAALDLRLADRVVVRMTPEAAAARKTPGKNT
jgi:cell division protein FtsQ